MKSHVQIICVAVVVALASLLPTAHAQTTVYRIVVPFEFNYGTTHLGPGIYTLKSDNLRHTLMIDNQVQSVIALVQVSDHRTTMGSSTALFRKYGDRYFFEELTIAGRPTGLSMFVSGTERRAARELARQREEPTALALALLPQRTLGH
jgi:hypothetical protein